MAAPPSKTLRDLNGTWVMVSPTQPLHLTSNPPTTEPPEPSETPKKQKLTPPPPQNKTLSDSVEPGLALQGISWLTRKGIGLATVTLSIKQYEEAGVSHIDIQQTATGGVKGTSENRVLDNEYREHSDWLFGKVKGRTEWLSETPLKVDEPFLAEGWEDGTAEWIHAFVQSLDSDWTAAQVWGFQNVQGERRYVRNTVIKKVCISD